MASRIEDYALISDCGSSALVGKDGSVDWLCWPRFDSEACFVALLGTPENGRWLIAPRDVGARITRRYRPNTLILETRFETDEGVVTVVDFMPERHQNPTLVRLVIGESGRVAMHLELVLRFGFGAIVPWVTSMEDGTLRAVAGPDMVVLHTPVHLEGHNMTTVGHFAVAAGEMVPFLLTYASSHLPVPAPLAPQSALDASQAFWRNWSARCCTAGPWSEAVMRSLITLKALTYGPTGGVVAAVTTSLPERIGGPRNWDYRYCWLRDTAFTLLTLIHAGYVEEAVEWRKWLLRAVAGAPDQVQTIYGISGERQLVEWEAGWLPGYEGSRPVRIGNAAFEQFQLDVFGEVVAALSRTPRAEDEIRVSASSLLAALANHLCDVWREPDEGIWEVRGGARHFTHSKVMAWVALDRAIKHHAHYGRHGDVMRRKTNRKMIHREVCRKGFDKKLNSFVQSYGSKQLDAACLLIGMVGFLPPDDPRVIGTVEAIEKRLMKDGFVERYDTKKTKDGLSGGEGAFLACSFWLVTSLWLIGRKADAKAMFERLLARGNDVGLLSEEYDPVAKRLVGNFPQALSHIALLLSAFALSGLWKPEPSVKTKGL